MQPVIRWDLLADALAFYQKAGFHYVEAPWIVSREAMDITRPAEAIALWAQGGNEGLVGSAEQGFLEMYLRGSLPMNRFLVAASPCFRPSDTNPTRCSLPTFFKVELGYFLEPGRLGGLLVLQEIALVLRRLAGEFLRKSFPHILGNISEEPLLSPEERGPLWERQVGDLLIGGAEVGSYGVRKRVREGGPPLAWAFGTGLAEPRTSWAVGELSQRGERPTL